MQLKIFSIYDEAVQAYNTPFFMLTRTEAMRAFENMARDENTNISKHKSDYHLYYLGVYDNATGLVKQDDGITDLGSADLFKDEEQQT